MRRITLLVILCFSLASAARADEASKRAKVQELFVLLHVEHLSQQILSNVMKQTSVIPQQVFGNAELTPDVKVKFDAFQKQVFQAADSQIGWKALQPDYTTLYAQTYTEEELDGIIAFYKSPVGTSMLAKSGPLSNKSMELVQAKMTAIQPQLKKLVDDFIRDTKPTTAQPPPTAQPAPKKETPK